MVSACAQPGDCAYVNNPSVILLRNGADRCANPCSLYPPPEALASVAVTGGGSCDIGAGKIP